MSNTLNAKIVSIISTRKDGTPFTKSNGASYNLVNCVITDGPLKGQRVLAQRTTINADGIVKDEVVIGQEVVLYPSKSDTGTIFLEVSTATPTVSNEMLAEVLYGEVASKSNATADSMFQ